MSVENRELLRRQLEQQGKIIAEESNDIRLIQSVLAACSALLRTAEKSMPASFSQEEFNGIYAGFLGISGKVSSFYENHRAYLSEDQSNVLDEMAETLRTLEKSKKELDEKISAARQKTEAESRKVDSGRSRLKEEEKRLEDAERKSDKQHERLSKIQQNISSLEDELKNINDRITGLEPEAERLTSAVKDAETAYAELTAYYAELERIRGGIKEEGYVDAESFSEKLQEMNAQGKSLMESYDAMLRNITADVEALQKKIDAKRKAGAIG